MPDPVPAAPLPLTTVVTGPRGSPRLEPGDPRLVVRPHADLLHGVSGTAVVGGLRSRLDGRPPFHRRSALGRAPSSTDATVRATRIASRACEECDSPRIVAQDLLPPRAH